jgi:hypothetical protein
VGWVLVSGLPCGHDGDPERSHRATPQRVVPGEGLRGHLKVRRVQGPILDTFYARLKKCGDLACSGKPFTEHHNVPDLRPSSDDRRPDREQVAGRLRAAIESGTLPIGSDLPSVRDLQAWQGIRRTTLRRAFRELSDQA